MIRNPAINRALNLLDPPWSSQPMPAICTDTSVHSPSFFHHVSCSRSVLGHCKGLIVINDKHAKQ